ncbi:cyclin-dependent kinases regulatory subunit 1 isoform X2 [Nomia melanderi]|uniref:cyclin-dependent kinases regulatory subunit 1 isoform X2 n=1 Tax=Nomia melanderi TaxID=2448451 RepID=UPI003FCD54F6
MPIDQIQYSEKYSDDKYEYRHVILPVDLARHVPKTHLMSETEWRNLGVQQSPGWVHYMMHVPGSNSGKCILNCGENNGIFCSGGGNNVETISN